MRLTNIAMTKQTENNNNNININKHTVVKDWYSHHLNYFNDENKYIFLNKDE